MGNNGDHEGHRRGWAAAGVTSGSQVVVMGALEKVIWGVSGPLGVA